MATGPEQTPASTHVPAATHVIVFANEKGGTGKSTTAVHVAIALAAKGARVACLDLDHRQRTVGDPAYRVAQPHPKQRGHLVVS